MTTIKPMAETTETVTLKRADFEALLNAAEDAVDLTAVEAHRAYEDRVGWETARRNYLTADEARRLLDGESPVRVWRQKRGIKQRTLAEAAEVSVSYLAEIEGGKKPGSFSALQRIAGVLGIPTENLMDLPRAGARIQPMDRCQTAVERLVKCAEAGNDRDRLADEADLIISEWQTLATREGWSHQLRAIIQALWLRAVDVSTEWASQSIALKDDGDPNSGRRLQRAANSLEAAIDELRRPRPRS